MANALESEAIREPECSFTSVVQACTTPTVPTLQRQSSLSLLPGLIFFKKVEKKP